MVLKVQASNPNGLLKAIKSAIAEGKIKTWSCDEDGDFTHTAQQWKDLDWFGHSSRRGS